MIKYIYILCLLWLHLHKCRSSPMKYRLFKSTTSTVMPNYQQLDLARMKFPNKDFCYEMEKTWKGSLLLPWWFQRCYDLKVMRLKESKNDNYFPKHKIVLDRIQYYRRNGLLRRNKDAVPTRTANWARRA